MSNGKEKPATGKEHTVRVADSSPPPLSAASRDRSF